MGHHGGRGTAAAAVSCLLVSFFLIFPYICVSPPKIETVSFFADNSELEEGGYTDTVDNATSRLLGGDV